ncbi:MAG: carbohydrate ABC transporter permease [Lachnospiraceae bacterium]
MKLKSNKREFFWGWLMVLPTVVGLLVLNIIPMIQTIYQSFFKTGDFGRGNVFIGLSNYEKLLQDQEVLQALLNTFKYAIMEVPISIFISLLLAVILNKKMRGRSIYRTIFFTPMVAAPAAVAMVWRWLYNSEYGLFNQIIRNLGGNPVQWLTNPNLAIVCIAVIGIWSILGYNMVLFLSGLQEVPKDYYEAARIDGANEITQFFRITLPLISPTMFFVTVTRTIAALQCFDLVFMLMERANAALPKTQTIVFLFYKYSFVQNNKGYGAAIGDYPKDCINLQTDVR